MQADPKTVLNGVLENVLEQFAFMFCEPREPGQLPEPDGALLYAAIEFHGTSSGRVDAAVPQAMAIELAANALGIDEEEESAAGAADALRELLNIICGQALTALLGDEPVFNLSIPSVTSCDHETWQALASDARTIHVMVEDYPFLLRVEAPEQQ